MTAGELIDLAHRQGMTLQLAGSSLTWRASQPPAPALLTSLKARKPEIIAALQAANDPPPQPAWLARVATLLGVSPAALLNEGHIDRHDLIEQSNTPPWQAASLIRSSPAWIERCR